MAHKNGTHVTGVLVNGNDYLPDLVDGTIETEIKDEEGKGIAESDDDPEAVGRSNKITLNVMIQTAAFLMQKANSADPTIGFDLSSGANEYSGTALIKTAGHTFKRDGIQMQPITLMVKGAMTIS